MLARRGDGLEDSAVEADGVATRAERNPIQIYGCCMRSPHAVPSRAPAPRASRVTRAGSGKFAGCARRSRASQRPTESATTSNASSAAASAGAWLRTPPTTSTSSATTDEHQRHGAVEAPGLGVRPRVERAHDLAALVGVRAGVLEQRSRCRCGPSRGSAEAAARGRPRPATGTGPPGSASGRARRRTRSRRCGSAASGGACDRQPLEHAGGGQQEDRVPRGEDRFGRHGVVFAAAASSPILATPAGSWISVNRMSSGSTRVMRLTVWRIPT